MASATIATTGRLFFVRLICLDCDMQMIPDLTYLSSWTVYPIYIEFEVKKILKKNRDLAKHCVLERSSEIHSPHIDPFISEIFAKDSAL